MSWTAPKPPRTKGHAAINPRRLLSVAFGAVVSVAIVLGSATSAEAHNYLVSSTPADGSTITQLPPQFEVTTNDNLLDLGSGSNGFFIEVKGPDGQYYGDGCITVQGPSITMPAALGPAGKYTLLWQVVSADGHTASDDLTFTWKPAADAKLSKGSAAIPDCHGTITVTTGSPADQPNPTTGDDGELLATVIWIGSAIVVAGLAAVITILVLSRSKKPKKSD